MIIKLTSRTMRVKAGYDWLKYQVGISREKSQWSPLAPDDSAFELLGWGETHEQAKSMAVRSLRMRGVQKENIQ